MLQKLFGFDATQHKVRIEVMAGITTFLTMAYILAVNPSIFSALEPLGMPTSTVFTATAFASIIGTLAMAFYAKKPFGQAPGMGMNAFFVFTVCLGMGYSWQFALTAVFIEGILFILLSLFKIRELIVNTIPAGMKAAIGASGRSAPPCGSSSSSLSCNTSRRVYSQKTIINSSENII